MKKFAAICVSLILLSFILIPNKNAYSQAKNKSKRNYAEGEIIVKLKDSVEPVADQEIADIMPTARGASVERLTERQRGSINLIRLNGALTVEQAVSQAQSDPRVEYAEPNYLYKTTDITPDDELFSLMWGLSNHSSQSLNGGQTPADISATQAWGITTGSDNLVVAIIDTGVDLSHPDLAANAWVNPREIPGNGVDDDGNGFVDDINGWNFVDRNEKVFTSSDPRHGTHVTGTIGAVGNNGIGVAGVAWHVKLMALKFLGSDGNGKSSNAVKAIEYVIDQKKRGTNVRVINASWGGGGESEALRSAIADAGAAGIVFVCSAGNDAVDNDETPEFPSGFATGLNNMISVASIDERDELSFFSNFGHTSVSVAAPGSAIISTIPNGEYGPIPNGMSGTSMASPHVAGIAALLLSNEPSLTPVQVRDRIIQTAEPIPALVSMTVSSGRANAFNALTRRIPPARSPVITHAEITKKKVTIEGLGFANGSAIIEVNGVPLSGVGYDSSFSLANGTLTRLTAKPGKSAIKQMFPAGLFVNVTVFNPTTGERSPQFTAVRF